MRLLVGLGNPGGTYNGTRHNIGFAALEVLAGRHGIEIGKKKFTSLIGRGRVGAADVMLVRPQTYMNLSGRAVRAILDYYRLDRSDLLVLHDDMDVAVGRVKFSARGGPGGHKGVASIIDLLGGPEFGRLKIGVGRPGRDQKGEDFVLSRFSPEEKEIMVQVLDHAAEAAEVFVLKGLAEAQARYNRRDLAKLKEEVDF